MHRYFMVIGYINYTFLSVNIIKKKNMVLNLSIYYQSQHEVLIKIENITTNKKIKTNKNV